MSNRNQLIGRVPQPDESGFAMLTCVIIASVAVLLATAVLAAGIHANDSTFRDRRHNLALQVAEAGVEQVVSQLEANTAYAGTGLTGTPVAIPGGEYRTQVCTPSFPPTATCPATGLPAAGGPGYRVIEAIGYVPSASAANAVTRRLRVVYGPEPVFQAAIFSQQDIQLGNGGYTEGDVFANGNITLGNGTQVEGHVVSATGTVELNGGSQVNCDGWNPTLTNPVTNLTPCVTFNNVYSGGQQGGGNKWGISLSAANAVIQGSAYAGRPDCVPNPPGPTTDLGNNRYRIHVHNSANITGKAYTTAATAGSVTNPNRVLGGVVDRCVQRQPAQTLPPYNSGNCAPVYPPTLGPRQNMTYSAFTAWLTANPTNVRGWFNVTGLSTDVINLTNRTITSDFVLETNTRLAYNNPTTSNPFYNGNGSHLINVISSNTSAPPTPAISFENQLQFVGGLPALLLYSQGYVDINNNAQINGAVYGNPAHVKNNASVTYDPRVANSLCFGGAKFNRVQWLEVSP